MQQKTVNPAASTMLGGSSWISSGFSVTSTTIWGIKAQAEIMLAAIDIGKRAQALLPAAIPLSSLSINRKNKSAAQRNKSVTTFAAITETVA